MLRDERNNELLSYLRYKLVKNNNVIDNGVSWFEDKDNNSKTGESLTLGTDENLKVLGVSAIVPGTGFALGIGSLAVGLLVIFPLIGGPPLTETETKAFEDLSRIGENIFNFSINAFSFAVKTSLIPLGVSAISIPKKLFRFLGEKYDEKAEPTYIENEKVIELINDILTNKEDNSLTFARTFFKRVNLNGNSDRFNVELLRGLAYHRFCLQSLETNKKTEEDANLAFDEIILQLQKAKRLSEVSDDFKNSRFINLLLENRDFREKQCSNSMKK